MTNKLLIGAIIAGIFLQFVVISVPFLADAFGVQMLTLFDWVVVLVFSLIPFTVNEIVKAFMRLKDK